MIAGSMVDIPKSDYIGALLGLNFSTEDSGQIQNRGFNAPVQSNENYNTPQQVNNDCDTKNTGDFCFTNTTKYRLLVKVDVERVSWHELTLEPNQTQCLYGLRASTYNYSISALNNPYKQSNSSGARYSYASRGPAYSNSFSRKGQIRVEKCKSKTFQVK